MIVKKLENLNPEMVVAEDVLNFQGLILLKKGTEISEKQIRMLKSWGVTEVGISGENIEPREVPIGSMGDIKEEVEKKMNEKFKKVTEDPILWEIKRIATDLLIHRKSRDENKPQKN
jgi:hypothetical protein